MAHHTHPKTEIERHIKHLFEEMIAFNKVLGFRVLSLDTARPKVAFDMRPDLIGSPAHQVLHGGVTASVLDALGGLAMILAIYAKHPDDDPAQFVGRFRKLGTIDLRIDYLSPGRGKTFIASSEVLRLGNKIGTAFMRMENEEGTLIATASGAYVIS
jgi:uncharacterized protein (TIGR00369 family)